LPKPVRLADPDELPGHGQQRVTHATITENKYLTAASACARGIEDARLAEPICAGKPRARNTRSGRKPPGPKGRAGKRADRRAAEAADHAAE